MEIIMHTFGSSPNQKEESKLLCKKFNVEFEDLENFNFKIIGEDLDDLILLLKEKRLAKTQDSHQKEMDKLINSGKKESIIKFIVISVILVLIFTFFFKMCSGPSDSSDSNKSKDIELLGKVSKTSTQIIIKSVDTQKWTKLEVEINGDFEYKLDEITPGQEIRIGLMQFTKSDGKRFDPFEYSVKDVKITGYKDGEIGIILGNFK